MPQLPGRAGQGRKLRARTWLSEVAPQHCPATRLGNGQLARRDSPSRAPPVGSARGPRAAPTRPRRPRRRRARHSHVRVPSEGVGDVLHHPLHQHRHLLVRLGHVGGRRDRARLRESPAAGGSSAGARARWLRRVLAEATEHFRVREGRNTTGLGRLFELRVFWWNFGSLGMEEGGFPPHFSEQPCPRVAFTQGPPDGCTRPASPAHSGRRRVADLLLHSCATLCMKFKVALLVRSCSKQRKESTGERTLQI